MFCCSLNTKNPRAHFYYIQVYFQNSLLTPDPFNQFGEIQLWYFSDELGDGSSLPQKNILCCLLCNGACSTTQGYSGFLVFLFGFQAFFNGIPIKTAVVRIGLIFTGNGCQLYRIINLIPGNIVTL